MSINEIREKLDALRWHRMDATGGTREENRRTRLPAILAPHIAAVEALQIPRRFHADIERREWELEAAANVLTRWRATQSEGVSL